MGKERNSVKVSSDVRIVRNSVDLPPIDNPKEGDVNSSQAVISVILNGKQSSTPSITDDLVDDEVPPPASSNKYASCFTLFHFYCIDFFLFRISKQAFKERLRASAGGGMGPSYKGNTR